MRVFFTVMVLLILGTATVIMLRTSERDIALRECVEEVSNKCSSLFNYAVSLENENARLNEKLKSCRGRYP